MQLKSPIRIRETLALATCSLLGLAPAAASAQDTAPWKTDTALLIYSEDQRVTIAEPVVNMRKEYGENDALNLKFVFDAMTGASPNGATATNAVQTFTTPSGNETYTAKANETPLRSFSDERAAVSVDWEKGFSRLRRGVFGGSLSIEGDYASMGLSATLSQDYNDRLTTLTGGLATSLDLVQPEGGFPVGLQLASATSGGGGGEDEDEGDSESKTKVGVDTLIGVTQILSRRALVQLNYGYSMSNGYLTDPYKIVSVVNGTTGATVDYRYEKRPDSRARNTVYVKGVYHLPEDVVHVSYRYFWDDWGVTSHTADLQYRFELPGENYLQPHVRYYHQNAADFYRHSLVSTAPVPEYASADYRLGTMDTWTMGLKYGHPMGKNSEWNARVEYMRQSGDSHPSDAIGIQRTQDLFPTVQTWIVQLGVSFDLDWGGGGDMKKAFPRR